MNSLRRSLSLSLYLLCVGCSNGGNGDSIDYSLSDSWFAFPGKISGAIETPGGSGLSSLEATAPVDVFYVHPTTCNTAGVSNCAIDEADSLTKYIMRGQVSAFNAVGRIFAPKYRQMVLSQYRNGDLPGLQDGLSFAYRDVQQAFRYYIEHYNNGRPFIIVSHSQGTDHTRRLLMEEVHGRSIQNLFVAAWTPGQPTPYKWFESDLPLIPPCTSPDQIGCLAVWQTFGKGFTDITGWNSTDVYWDGQAQRYIFPTSESIYNVNPLTWTTETEYASPALNLGTVPLGVTETNFTGLYPGVVGAQNTNGYLVVDPVPLPSALFPSKTVQAPLVYHTFDVALFWLNIRNNARVRVQSFLIQRRLAKYPLITSSNQLSGKVGSTLSYFIETFNAGTHFTATDLPEGLLLDSATGVLSGTPRKSGVFPVVLSAENTFGLSTAELAIVVKGN